MLRSYADLDNYGKVLKKLQNEIWSQISTRAEQMELDKTGMFKKKIPFILQKVIGAVVKGGSRGRLKDLL